MNNEKRFIGIDLGAESGRCVVATIQDRKIRLEEVHRFATHTITYERGFHWDIRAICEDVIEGLAKAQRVFGPDFAGIGVDTWGVDYVLVDDEDRALGYPYHYRDDRTDNMMEEAFEVVPKETLYAKTGVQFAQFNTLFQLLAEKKSKSNHLRVANKMLLMPDYLNFVLCGNKKAEFSIASTTAIADPSARNWSWELIEAFGLPKNIFPEMVEPGTVLGTLLPPVAAKTGLSPNIPIIACAGHDTASAVVSVPASDDGWAFLSSGTWSLLGVELKNPILSIQSMTYNFTNEGGVDGTTRFLKNIVGLWPVQECKRYWSERGNDCSYPRLTAMAKEIGFVESWVDLSDPRFLKAGGMPEKMMAYLQETGQTAKSDAGFLTGVVLESLAFSYRKTKKEIEVITGQTIDKIHAVGGGIQNELLTQYTADAIGRPVLAGPVEGTVVGNIGVQAVAVGAVSGYHEWRKIVANSFPLKVYRPAHTRYFDENEMNYSGILRSRVCP